ncbi:MAG: hypothetical protein KGL40_02690 [Rhodocyclaceae bacterium]|nr:hypothetical protein [Rhodocyclaceae bacterium]
MYLQQSYPASKPNNSFKPNLLRYSKSVAEKACHAFASTTQVGLTQALGRGMNSPLLHYSDLSMEAIKDFHQQHGGLKIELSPSHGKRLLSLLDQRDRLEKELLTGTSIFRLLWNHLFFLWQKFIAFMFHNRLLFVERYVRGVDATHGYDTSPEGKHTFLLLPLNKDRPNPAVKRDAPQAARPLP